MFNINQIPTITKNLLIINILMFIADQVVLAKTDGAISLQTLLMAYTPMPDSLGNFKGYQIITHMFMHAGVFHLFTNMFGLLIFGSVVERELGAKKFLILYFASGLGSYFLQTSILYYNGAYNVPMLGASGALYGVVVAFAMIYPKARISLIFLPFFSLEAQYFIPLLIGADLIFGLTDIPGMPNIGHFAHIGGAIVGYVLLYFWRKNRYRWN